MIEFETFLRRLPELLGRVGHYAVVRGEELLGTGATYREALDLGYESDPNGRFVVMRIGAGGDARAA